MFKTKFNTAGSSFNADFEALELLRGKDGFSIYSVDNFGTSDGNTGVYIEKYRFNIPDGRSLNIGDLVIVTNIQKLYQIIELEGYGNPDLIRTKYLCDIKGEPGKSAYSYAKDGGYSGTEEEFAEKLVGEAIPIPTSAAVGQTVVVKTVDENGKPTEWKAVDIPEQVQTDWNQTDEAASDYIKNRTHYHLPGMPQYEVTSIEVNPKEKPYGVYPLLSATRMDRVMPYFTYEKITSHGNAYYADAYMKVPFFGGDSWIETNYFYIASNLKQIDSKNSMFVLNPSYGLDIFYICDTKTLTDEYKDMFSGIGVYLRTYKGTMECLCEGVKVVFRYFSTLDVRYISSSIASTKQVEEVEAEVEEVEKRVDILEVTIDKVEPTFYITITDNGNGTYSADKTVEEIEAAYNKGGNILLVAPINQDPFSGQTESIYDTRNISVSRDEYDVLYIYGLFRLISYVSDTEVEHYEVVLYNNGADELTVEYSKYIEIYASNSYVNDEISNVYVAMDSKITAPAIAEVGRVIAVKEVNESGKPTEWEAIDIPEQIQTDWTQTDETAVDYIKNKPTIATGEDTMDLVTELGYVTPVASSDGSIYIKENGVIYSL